MHSGGMRVKGTGRNMRGSVKQRLCKPNHWAFQNLWDQLKHWGNHTPQLTLLWAGGETRALLRWLYPVNLPLCWDSDLFFSQFHLNASCLYKNGIITHETVVWSIMVTATFLTEDFFIRINLVSEKKISVLKDIRCYILFDTEVWFQVWPTFLLQSITKLLVYISGVVYNTQTSSQMVSMFLWPLVMW